MTRPGRKRKARVTRQPNGRPRQPTAQDIMAVARAAPHRQILDARGKVPDPRDARLGSELGRLRLRDRITAEQYAAGLRWGRIIARMSRAIAAPLASPQGILAALAGTSGPARDMSPEDVAEALADCTAAERVIPRRARRVLRLVVVLDHPCHDLPALCGALDALVGHFEERAARNEGRVILPPSLYDAALDAGMSADGLIKQQPMPGIKGKVWR